MLASSSTQSRISKIVWQVFSQRFGLGLQAEAAELLCDKLGTAGLGEDELIQALAVVAQAYVQHSGIPSLLSVVDRVY